MALQPLELRCFGPPTARLGGTRAGDSPAELRWRKHVALLVYLALSPGLSRSRDHLLGLLWGEQPERGARKSLNMAVRRLRVALGEARLRSEGDAIALSDEALDVDALRLARQPAAEEALPLLRGDFLEGFHVADAPEFDDWMTRERGRYRALAVAALVTAGERRLNGGGTDAADLARRALALDPRSEPAVRLLMRAAALGGDSAGALHAYQELARRLEAEVHEQPGRALAALAARIRTRPWLPPQPGHAVPEPPLVGRDAQHRSAFETIARAASARSGPQTLLITAAAGMGRSRLAAECVRRLALDGALVLQARPVESDHDARWSALRLLLRSGLDQASGLAGARPESLGALAAVVPALAERFAPRALRDVGDMSAALSDVLRSIAVECPVAIMLDDAHWADGASIGALGNAVAALETTAVALILTVPEAAADAPRELVRLQSEIGRALPGVVVRLTALTPDDVATLTRTVATWCEDDRARERLTRRIAFETAGSPFFAATLLGALGRASRLRQDMMSWPPAQETYAAALPFSIPSMARHAMALRLAELSEDERMILNAASICGQVLEPELLAAVTERDESVVRRALQAFERCQLVQFDGRRYTFAAPVIAQVVRAECLTRGQRHELEGRAADALAGNADLEARVLRVELLAATQPHAQVFEAALAAMREAIERGARRTAQRAAAVADAASRGAQLDRAGLDELRARLKTMT